MSDLVIDPNRWLQIYPAANLGSVLVGTELFNNTAMPGFEIGSVSVNKNTGSSLNSTEWQIFPLNESTYALRTIDSGAKGFLNTHFAAELVDTPGHTTVNMRNSTSGDKAMLWNIGRWGDGSLYFTNVANGSRWLLTQDASGVLMAPNVSTARGNQSWQIREVDSIKHTAFSFVLGTPVFTASPTASVAKATATSTASIIMSSTCSCNKGVSPGAAAGIGLSVTAIALIAMLSMAFFFLRKRNTRTKPVDREKELPPPPSYEPPTPKLELAAEQKPVEIGHEQRPIAELMGETDAYK